jgi:hypothetical protein
MRLSLGKTKSELMAFAVNLRREFEDAGISVGDMAVASDDRSKTLIIGSLMAARGNPQWRTVWQTADGVSVEIGPPEIETISALLQAHVNGVFTAYSQVVERIQDDTLVSVSQIEEYFTSLLEELF